MKKILFALFFILCSASVFAQLQQQSMGGSPTTLNTVQGGFWPKLYMVIPKRDTVSNPAKFYPGAITIRPQDTLLTDYPPIYMSNGRFWFVIAGNGQGIDSITVSTDSTLYQAYNQGNQVFTFSTLLRHVRAGANVYFTRDVDTLVVNAVTGGAANGLVSVGGLVLSDSTLYVQHDIVWKINNVLYTRTTDTFYVIPSADTGYYRKDLIYIDSADGSFNYVQGTQDTVITNPPVTPQGGIVITVVDVFGPTISEPVPFVTSGFWSTIGNGGTNSTTNFLGTTDSTNLVFRIKDVSRMYLDRTNNDLQMNQGTSIRLQAAGGALSDRVWFGDNSIYDDGGGNMIFNEFVGGFTFENGTTGAEAKIGRFENKLVAPTVIGSTADRDINALLDLQTTSMGLLNSRLTTAQMVANSSNLRTGAITTPGSGYTNGTYSGLSATGGSGTGATFNITVTGNAVSAVQISNTGRNYVVGDVLSASVPGGTGFTYTVSATGTAGIQVYNTDSNSVFQYNGTAWQNLYNTGGGGGIGWSLSGNSGTDQSIDFLGTTDGQGLTFKVNNTFSGRLEQGLSANVSLGQFSFLNNSSGTLNTAYGTQALRNNTSGIGNTSVGAYSMWINTTGSYNMGVGGGALGYNVDGEKNVGVGTNAGGFNNSNGTISIGYGAGVNLFSQSHSLFIGDSTASGTGGGDGANEIVIGDNLTGNGSNTITFGNSSNTGTFLGGYGNGTITGTPTYSLSVNSAGKIIETASGGGGGTTTVTITVATAGQTAFTFSSVPATLSDYVIFKNGIALEPTNDYTTSGNIVTLVLPATVGDRIRYQRIK